jgi:hypothetical protein
MTPQLRRFVRREPAFERRTSLELSERRGNSGADLL